MTTEIETRRGYVVLTEEKTLMRAHLVAGALAEAGIDTFVDEDNLADEFAMSQKLLGALRVRVLVPSEKLTEAQSIFLAMSQPIPVIDEDDPELEAYAQSDRARKTRILWLGIFLVVILPLLFWGVFLLLEKLD